MMTVTESENDSKGWKKFLMKHWKIATVFVVGCFGSCQRRSCTLMVHRECSINWNGTYNIGSMDNGKYGGFSVAFDFLGSSNHRNPSNHCSISRVVMVEKAT